MLKSSIPCLRNGKDAKESKSPTGAGGRCIYFTALSRDCRAFVGVDALAALCAAGAPGARSRLLAATLSAQLRVDKNTATLLHTCVYMSLQIPSQIHHDSPDLIQESASLYCMAPCPENAVLQVSLCWQTLLMAFSSQAFSTDTC